MMALERRVANSMNLFSQIDDGDYFNCLISLPI